MTKQQRFVSRLQLSRICHWILTLGALKLGILAFLMLVPVSKDNQKDQIDPAVATNQTSAGQSLVGMLNQSVPVRGQVAHAAGVSEAQPVTVPAPKIPSGQSASPYAQSSALRPDEATTTPALAPKISPFVPRDSAQRKQEELNRREQELLALQQQMENRLDELHTLEGKIQDMLKQANTVQDDKLKHLIDVYSNMKAKQAAAVLSTLDERIAVRILAGMRGKQAGEILTYMQAEPAAKLSELLSRTQLPDR